MLIDAFKRTDQKQKTCFYCLNGLASSLPHQIQTCCLSKKVLVLVNKVMLANISAQIAGKIALSVIGFFIISMLCRYLSIDDFGSFTLAFSIVGFFCPLVEMGMNTIAVREISQDRASESYLLPSILMIRLALTFLSVIIIIIFCYVMKYPPEVRLMTLLASLLLFSTLLGTLEIPLIVLQKMYVLVVSQVISNIVLLSSVYYLISIGSSVKKIILLQVFCTALTYLIILYFIRHDISFKKPNVATMLPFLRSSLQQGTASIIVSYYINIDMVILSKLVGTGAVAYYGASYRILALMIFVPHAVMMSLYPVLIMLKSKNEQNFNHIFKFTFYLMMLLAFSLATWITFNAEPLVLFVFTDRYVSSVPALKILVWSGVFTFANYLAGYTLVIIHRQAFGIVVSLTALFANIALNLLLIPFYGIAGAALVTVTTELIVAVMLYNYIYHHEKLIPFSYKLLRIIIVVIGTVFVSFLTQNLHILVAATLFSLFVALFAGGFYLIRDRAFLQRCKETG